MIEARFAVIVTATDDDEVDAVIATLTKQSKSWPGMPIVQVRETSRVKVED